MRKEITKPLLVYDGECKFCLIWIERWKYLTSDRIEYAPFQEVTTEFPQIPLKEFERAVQLIMPDGQVLSAAEAVFRILAYAPGRGWLWWIYKHLPGFATVSKAIYRLIASHRSHLYSATLFLFGSTVKPATYLVSTWLFLKALGIVYLMAFVSFGIQAVGLIGAHGILPVSDFLKAIHAQFGDKGFWLAPTILWLNSGDWFIKTLCISGVIFSLFLVIGMAQRIMLVLLFLLYLSLVTGGQTFMSFQWDILLLETGFLAIFLNTSSGLIQGLFWCLIFRLIFLSGAVKLLSGDSSWRNLTALAYHYENQPLPTVLGWYMHQLPAWFHKFSTAVVFVIELGVTFLIFGPRHLRFFAGFSIIFLQFLIFVTGNYTFFNILTVAVAIFLFDDVFWQGILPSSLTTRIVKRGKLISFWQNLQKGIIGIGDLSGIGRIVVYTMAFFILILNAFQLWEVFARSGIPSGVSVLLRAVGPFHVVNRYGLFAVMTTSRPEIVIEGSNDGKIWLSYEFKYKPGDLRRHPRWIQPHQPRLDWQMWFAALESYEQNRWFVNFIIRLLQGSSEVLGLLEKNPFPNEPPRYIRALLYDYHFTGLAAKHKDGTWWRRELKGFYFPPASLR